MAAPQCMSNDGKPAVFVGTFMQSGDAVALCEDCLPAFTGSVTADMFGVDGTELLEWLKEHGGQDTAGDAETAAELAAPPAMLPSTSASDSAPGTQSGSEATSVDDPTLAGAGEPAASSEGTGDAPVAADGPEGTGAPPAEGETTEAKAT